MERAHFIVPVLQHRETKSRLTLGRLAHELVKARAQARSIEQMIESVEERLEATLAARDAMGPRTVAVVTDLDEQLKALRAARNHLDKLKDQAHRIVDDVLRRHQIAIREWRRHDARLSHIDSLVRRERVTRVIRTTEREEETQTEERAAREARATRATA